MRRFFSQLNPTVRGFAVIVLVAAAIVVLRLEATLVALRALIGILFVLAIGFFVYRVWRENRSSIATWSARAQVVFYGAAALILVDLAAAWWGGIPGLRLLAFLAVLGLCGFAMWRVWRDQHSYGL